MSLISIEGIMINSDQLSYMEVIEKNIFPNDYEDFVAYIKKHTNFEIEAIDRLLSIYEIPLRCSTDFSKECQMNRNCKNYTYNCIYFDFGCSSIGKSECGGELFRIIKREKFDVRYKIKIVDINGKSRLLSKFYDTREEAEQIINNVLRGTL